jgi:hypothetical protein
MEFSQDSVTLTFLISDVVYLCFSVVLCSGWQGVYQFLKNNLWSCHYDTGILLPEFVSCIVDD